MECLKRIIVKHKGVAHSVPCGKCGFCLQNKRSQWMFRVHHEMTTQQMRGFFLTLTYADHMVPKLDDGRLTLRFRHTQLFLKKLRKAGYKCKYIFVGEYGGETGRPHYHAIFWTDCPPLSLEAFWSNSRGKIRGRIHIGSLTMASAMYCLKYILQPKVSEQEYIGPDGLTVFPREKTRAQYSKGIGLGYLTNSMYEWHTDDYENPIIYGYIFGQKFALPRYYRNKIFTKYQMAVEGERLKEKARKEYLKEFWSAPKKVRATFKAYRLAIRTDESQRIISKTKLGQTL